MVTADLPPALPRQRATATTRLEHLPVSVFAVVMGLAGTSLAWRRAASAIALPSWVSTGVADAVAWVGLLVFSGLVAAYAIKGARYPAAVRAEWRHPVKLAFVPTGSIALVVLAAALPGGAAPLPAALWWAGATIQAALTLDVVRTWIADPRFAVAHVHPAWFIPVVGNLVVPIAGVDHAPAQITWYFFGIGLVYWLALLPLVLGRLIVGGSLPAMLMPTLAVLVAPPAVADSAWVRLGGHWNDPMARILLAVTVFQVLLLAVQAPALRQVPFAISSWAYSFPLAAAASATLSAGHAGAGSGYTWLGAALLAVVSVLVAALTARTLIAVRRGEICRPDVPTGTS